MMQMKIKADINADIFSQAEADVKRTMQEIGNIQAAASGYLADIGEYPDFANNCNDAITVFRACTRVVIRCR
jgi:hypothetical protein